MSSTPGALPACPRAGGTRVPACLPACVWGGVARAAARVGSSGGRCWAGQLADAGRHGQGRRSPACHAANPLPPPTLAQVLLTLPRALRLLPQALPLRVHAQGAAGWVLRGGTSAAGAAAASGAAGAAPPCPALVTGVSHSSPCLPPCPALPTCAVLPQKVTLLRHLAKCTLRHPPGDEIYRSPPPPPNDPSFVGGAITNPPIRCAAGG